ncbi:MAG: hypothetical protein LBK52_06335, partial [Deltaproteobacteria bacterium]|nr:hypothetical protein [Deltaproteobacteria bacterium]
MKKSWSRRRKILLCLPVLGIILLGGAFLLLRSSFGERLVFEQVQKALASSGLILSAQSFRGPLPQKLAVSQISLADRKGVFLTAGRLTAEVSLSSLFHGLLAGRIFLTGAELSRRPELPEQPAAASSGSAFPLGLQVSLDLTESLVQGAALNPATPPGEARVSLRADFFMASGKLTFALDGSLMDEEGRGVFGSGRLGSAEGAPDQLELDLTVRDAGGRLTGPRPDLPQILSLTVKGSGPLTVWPGRIQLLTAD